MAKTGSIKHYRQAGSVKTPTELPYGELAVAKDGTMYAGDENNLPVEVVMKTNHQLLAYTSLDQIGLSGAVTMEQVCDALPDNSVLTIANSVTASDRVSDAPTDYCCITIIRSTVGYCYCLASPSTSSSGADLGLYKASYRSQSTPKFSGWVKFFIDAGGILTGDVTISKTTPAIFLINTSKGTDASLFSGTHNVQLKIRNVADDESNYRRLSLFDSADQASVKYGLALLDTVNSTTTTYRIYGEHNITVSTAAPSSALANGTMHMVY